MLRLQALICVFSAIFSVISCGDRERPLIRVGINMELSELISGSTFPFAKSLSESYNSRDCGEVSLEANWVISEKYDLMLVNNSNSLIKKDIGGPGYLVAITTDSNCKVNAIRLTFQNHNLTLDEAFAEATRVQRWLDKAGFRNPTLAERQAEHLPDPFAFEQEINGRSYSKGIANYAEARQAFLDSKAQIDKIVISNVVSIDVVANIWINRTRGVRTNVSRLPVYGQENAREFRVYFDLGSR